jgi:hypothetical protein
LALAAVGWQQCVISTVAAGSSAAAMFPLFITHDEYFVRCSGNGGGYYDVFDLSSYKLLSEHYIQTSYPSTGTRVLTNYRCLWNAAKFALQQIHMPFLIKVFLFGIDCLILCT